MADHVRLVASFFAVTFTLGTIPPDTSVTVLVWLDLPTCANSAIGRTESSDTIPATLRSGSPAKPRLIIISRLPSNAEKKFSQVNTWRKKNSCQVDFGPRR